MLKFLSVKNVVLIDSLDLEFKDGLSVFTGETGAGKSILLDALGLLLGKKAETRLIRKGADKLAVCGVFEIKDRRNPFYKLCAENELEIEDEIIIKRTFTQDGKSKIFLNDQPVTLKLLKELGSYLVEIHGQFDNQGLFNPENHLKVLDLYGGLTPVAEKVQQAFLRYKNLKKKLRDEENAFDQAAREEETLRHFTEELRQMDLKENEEAELVQKRTEAMHAEKLIENFNTAYNALEGENISSFIRKAQSAVARINHLTQDRYADLSEFLETALVQIDEVAARLEQASSEISLNASETDRIEERLFALKALARKHQCQIDDLPRVLQDLEHKISLIEKRSDTLVDLQKETDRARTDYLSLAQELSEMRKNAAHRFDEVVCQELPPLKMERAVFQTEILKLEESAFNESGIDSVVFKVATNPNSLLGPLHKIASGGELARLMLALKVNLSAKTSVDTLIFDEIDTGIGGATAEAVGERLSRLSQNLQVMVVTHSPQVAAFSQSHFKVCKTTDQNITTTSVKKLSEAEKKEEIARMLSGEKVTDAARAAADELIACNG